jgi:diadenosine tetraphosphate (Ap4A) HIT family hydrolase
MALTLDPGTVIAVEPLWTLAVNRNQNLIGKTMLVANRPVESVPDLTLDEWTDLRTQITRLTTAVRHLFAPDQFNHAFLMNADAQVHLHVVPRYRSPRRWHGHTFTDPHFGELYGKEQQILDAPELARLSGQILQRLP